MAEYKNFQIFRVDGKNVFLEVLKSAFAIGKVQINFIEYNDQNKQTKKIQTYMDINKFLVLKNDILSGKLSMLAKKEKANKAERVAEAKKNNQPTKYIYCKEIFTDMGGITKKRLSTQKDKIGFEIPEGCCVSRMLLITPGEKKPWIISGQQGVGKESDKGLIVPQGNPKEIVRVPMENDDLKAFVLATEINLIGYYSSLYKAM